MPYQTLHVIETDDEFDWDMERAQRAFDRNTRLFRIWTTVAIVTAVGIATALCFL